MILKFLKNRIGWIFVATNAALFLCGIFLRGFLYRDFELYGEPLPLELFVYANLPSIVAANLVTNAFDMLQRPGWAMIFLSKQHFVLTMAFVVLQWLLIGYLVSNANRYWRTYNQRQT
jgi:hypothetical protein